MKKFCFILTQSLESPGGIGRYFPLAKSLVKKGYKVNIIALHHDYKNASKRIYGVDGINIHEVGQMYVYKRNDNKIYFEMCKFIWIVVLGNEEILLCDRDSSPKIIVRIMLIKEDRHLFGELAEYLYSKFIHFCSVIANYSKIANWEKINTISLNIYN